MHYNGFIYTREYHQKIWINFLIKRQMWSLISLSLLLIIMPGLWKTYLRHVSSFIVFEFQQNGGLCFSILFSKIISNLFEFGRRRIWRPREECMTSWDCSTPLDLVSTLTCYALVGYQHSKPKLSFLWKYIILQLKTYKVLTKSSSLLFLYIKN